MTELFVVITVIVVALIFDFTNGFHDSANAMAGPVATGALRPRTAVILAALLNVVGACLSTEVAKTISGGLFDDSLITVPIILAGTVPARRPVSLRAGTAEVLEGCLVRPTAGT